MKADAKRLRSVMLSHAESAKARGDSVILWKLTPALYGILRESHGMSEIGMRVARFFGAGADESGANTVIYAELGAIPLGL